jgi:hypothetical protein
MKPPNYRGAIQRLRGIKPKKERIAGINGEIGGIYDTVVGFKVNKKAARIFLALDGLESDEQQDIWRSLTGLIDAAEWSIGDLVDRAEGAEPGNIIKPDFGRREQPQNDEEIDKLVADVETPKSDEPEVDPAEERKRRDAEFDAAAPKAESPAEKRKRIKEAHAKGAQPDAATQEPYTGDNSDLNPE